METLEKEISADERGLLREVIRALRSLRYGSVSLTVHDGRLVEIQKIERIPNERRESSRLGSWNEENK